MLAAKQKLQAQPRATNCGRQITSNLTSLSYNAPNTRLRIRPNVAAQEAPPAEDIFTKQDWDVFISSYKSIHKEHVFWLDEAHLEGTIPNELQGTLLRNGPGLFEIGDTKINQPFDGDGHVLSFAFPGNGQPPFIANRYIRTEAFVKEQLAQKMLYRGAFQVGNPAGGLFFNPFDIAVKPSANTGIVHWASRTLALYERDLPYELAHPDLRTVGETSNDLNGNVDAPYMAAHYRIATQPDGSRRLVAFCSEEMGTSLKNTVWEFDEHTGKQLNKTEFVMAGNAFAFQHDFLVSEKYYIFLENPIKMDLWKLVTEYMFGKACIAECLKYDPSLQTKIHIIPRPSAPGKPSVVIGQTVIPTPQPFFSFHHVNAYQDPANKDNLVIETVALLDGVDFSANMDNAGVEYYSKETGRGSLCRIVVDLKTNQVVEQKKLIDRAVEFPCVAPKVVGKKHTFAYLVAARFATADKWGPPQVVCKVEYDDDNNKVSEKVYNPGRKKFAQEPIFVPRPGGSKEDDGWVLVLVYDSENAPERTELVILDAQNMDRVASIRLPFRVPPGLHGSFTVDYLGPDAGDKENWKPLEYDIRQSPLKYEYFL